MSLLCVTVFHMSLNWHKNYSHWHGHASAEHWHYQAWEHEHTAMALSVLSRLQESVIIVVLCYCSRCFDHFVVEVALTMENAMMYRCRLAPEFLDRCELEAMVVN
jgi:hypothetical protein